MTVTERFKKRYRAGNTPWDIGRPDFNLIEVVERTPIQPCKALDIGCGTGDNAIWLSQNNFQVTGSDASGVAIDKAKAKATEADVNCHFVQIDFMERDVSGAPFGLVFDRGCFHAFASDDTRKLFAEKVAAALDKAGMWLTLVGNADEERQGPGPPQRTAGDIVRAVEPYFKILSLETSHFDSDHPNPPRAWRCLLQKRNAG